MFVVTSGVLDFELKFNFLEHVGMLRRKENCHSKAEGFSFCMVIIFISYPVSKKKMLGSHFKTSEVTTHISLYP